MKALCLLQVHVLHILTSQGTFSPPCIAAAYQDAGTALHHARHGGSAVCRRTRTLNSGWKPGQGRPLGFLLAWLRAAGNDTKTKACHDKVHVTREMRQEARAWLRLCPWYQDLHSLESAKGDDSDSEPEYFEWKKKLNIYICLYYIYVSIYILYKI